MKKLLILFVVGILLLAGSCSLFEKTYSIEITGFCEEITTPDADLITALDAAGWTESACSGTYASTKCSFDYPGFTGTSVTVYFGTDLYGDAATISAVCEMSGWTVN